MIYSAYPHRVIDREPLSGIDYSNEAPLDGLAAALADQHDTDHADALELSEARFELARVLA